MAIFYDKILAQLRLDYGAGDGAKYDYVISRQMYFRTAESDGYTFDTGLSQVRQGDLGGGGPTGDGFLLETDVDFLLLEDDCFLLLE
jgi:hypothetical protein